MLAEAGARVAILDRDAEAAAAVAEALPGEGHFAVTVNRADELSIIAAMAQVAATAGAPWLPLNNAGLQDRRCLIEASTGRWDRMHAVDARGAFPMLRKAARTMVGAGKGKRIANSFPGGLDGSIVDRLLAYVAGKGTRGGMTLSAAYELAEHQTTLNAGPPGTVVTPGATAATGPATRGSATPPCTFGHAGPREIGAAVLFFASPAAVRVNDQQLAVDGGWSVS